MQFCTANWKRGISERSDLFWSQIKPEMEGKRARDRRQQRCARLTSTWPGTSLLLRDEDGAASAGWPYRRRLRDGFIIHRTLWWRHGHFTPLKHVVDVQAFKDRWSIHVVNWLHLHRRPQRVWKGLQSPNVTFKVPRCWILLTSVILQPLILLL